MAAHNPHPSTHHPSLPPSFPLPSPENYFYDNIKLTLMLVACAFAMVAQFYPMPFPESRPLLGVCCLAYFLASTIIQLIVSYAEQDAILTTQPLEGGKEGGLRVRTQFPRFQDEYTVILEEVGVKEPPTVSSKFGRSGGGRKGEREGGVGRIGGRV